MSVKFSTPDPITNIIVVSRVLPDNTTEPFGNIYADFRGGEDSAMYISTDNNGRALFPPTDDFIDLEIKFIKYSQELSKKSLTEEMKSRADEFEKRKEFIKEVRRWKIKPDTKLISR